MTTHRRSVNGKSRDDLQFSSLSSTSDFGNLIARFLFDADSPNGGFHRLLLHGVCQFHCLHATSSTTEINIMVNDSNVRKRARVLTATGTLSGADVRLVDFITQRQQI